MMMMKCSLTLVERVLTKRSLTLSFSSSWNRFCHHSILHSTDIVSRVRCITSVNSCSTFWPCQQQLACVNKSHKNKALLHVLLHLFVKCFMEKWQDFYTILLSFEVHSKCWVQLQRKHACPVWFSSGNTKLLRVG